MTFSRKHRAAAGFGVSIVATLAAFGASADPALNIPRGMVLPPLSVAKAQYFRAHPAEWKEFLAGLAQLPAATPRATTTAGGTWTAVTKAPFNGLCNPLLLTDATVIVASCDTKVWYKLTPDNTGSYANGTWAQIASLPVIGGTQYQPQYHASAVLPDGRVIIEGGEYNGGGTGVWTNLGAIYDPLADQWTAVTAPTGASWNMIGDAQSTVLANGTFMLASCCADPDANALLDATTLTWTTTGAPSAGAGYQDEQGYELLPNTDVLTVDIWTKYNSKGDATNAERYSQSAGTWSSAGNTPVSLVDPYACQNFEIGPAVLRGDGTVVGFGGNSGCQASTADPTAIYKYKTNRWIAGPNVPAVCGSDGTASCSLPDSPAALLPNGNILFAASANFGGKPTHFFEYTTTNTIQQVSDPLFNSTKSGAYYYNFLVLPNGQILMTDFSKDAEVYTSAGSPVAGVAPVITKVPGHDRCRQVLPGARQAAERRLARRLLWRRRANGDQLSDRADYQYGELARILCAHLQPQHDDGGARCRRLHALHGADRHRDRTQQPGRDRQWRGIAGDERYGKVAACLHAPPPKGGGACKESSSFLKKRTKKLLLTSSTCRSYRPR